MIKACLAATEVRRRSGALNRCGDKKKFNVSDKVLVLRSSSSKFQKSRADSKQQRVEEVSSAEQFTRHRRPHVYNEEEEEKKQKKKAKEKEKKEE